MDTPLEPAQTSSPQTPSPPLPVRYFDFLPNELLQQIIEHLLPIEYTADNYRAPSMILRPICLTSKRLYQVSRPILAVNLWLLDGYRSKKGWEQRGVWKYCRWLRISIERLIPDETKLLKEIVRVATRLDNVAYGSVGESEPITIVLTSHLTKLHLSGVSLPLDFVFASPTLKQLSLHQVQLSNQETLVHDLPSLRHIGYSSRLGRPSSIPYTFLASLAPQLKSMTIPLHDITPLRSLQQQYDKLTILHYSTDLVVPASSNDAQHLRITSWAQFGVFEHRRLLDAAAVRLWVDFFASANSSLKSVYLPARISTTNHSLLDPLRSAVDALEATCHQRKIEIIYEDLVSDHAMESLISQEFVRRVERGPRRS